MDVSHTNSVVELERLRALWFASVAPTKSLPEAALVLNMKPRRNEPVRQFKYLHQMCLTHALNYRASQEVKHLTLVDAFLAMVNAENPLGLYAIARSMLELNAFLHEVQVRLSSHAEKATDTNWISAGEAFFATVVRARFATTNGGHLSTLATQGVSRRTLDPFNVMRCVDGLAEVAGSEDTRERYGLLCDFVHHNLGSATASNSGSGVSVGAFTRNGGGFRNADGSSMTVTQYGYPVRPKFDTAFKDVASGFLRDALGCTNWLELTPESVYSPELCVARTGSPFGMTYVPPANN